MGGLVSGVQMMVVTPPWAAAREAVANVSRYSAPGSPITARMSTRPGARTRPAHATRGQPSGASPARTEGPFATITPSLTRRPPRVSVPAAGSARSASVRISERVVVAGRVMGSRIGQVAGEGLKHGHPHGDADLDLLAYERLGAVGDARVDLDAAVHRARDA